MKTRNDQLEKYGRRREEILRKKEDLPTPGGIYYRAQETHFIAPASIEKVASKAALMGTKKSGELLERAQISRQELADALDAPLDRVERLIDEDEPPDLVLIDGEDAVALNRASIEAARKNAVEIFQRGEWKAPLKFYRPSGFDLEYCLEDLTTVLYGAAQNDPAAYPVDGVIFPKAERVDEIKWLCDLLGDIENDLGLGQNSIRLEFLSESAAAIEHLEELAKAVGDRLCGIIFGLADYGSEVGVGDTDNNNPVFDAARIKMVNTAAIFGCDAIDAMTFQYPVAAPEADPGADPVAAGAGASPSQKKEFILSRIRMVHDHTLHAIRLGMRGKWVGHPLQLLGAKLAFEAAHPLEVVERRWNQMKEYAQASQENRGAAIIGGEMADRATDRQTRSFLRMALRRGLLNVDEALQFGLINKEEARQIRGWRA